MMAIGIILFVLLLALLLVCFLKQLWSRRHLPPGPLALPFIGNMWAYGFWLREDFFLKPAKRYGNIYTLWIGSYLLVVLSGFKTVKEAMTSFPEEFSLRMEDPFLTDVGKGRGILLSNGHTWKEQRQIGITSLRKLGLGRKSMEHQLQDSAQKLVELFRQTRGEAFDPSFPVLNTVSNIIFALSFGGQLAPEDENFKKLAQALHVIVDVTGDTFHLLYNSLSRIMKYLPGPHQEAMAASEMIISFIKQEIEKHKESSSQHEPQDFIDYYLLQMEKSKNDPNSTCNEDNLAQCIYDFVLAGIDTTFASLKWILLLLATHLHIQEKVKNEIEDVFGFSQSISYQDRKKLPYTNAVIHEMQRVKYVMLFGGPRQSTKDVKMRGYHIPKGAFIITDLRSVLFDPEQWETPEEFNPNHFLDKDGKFRDREEFLAFGLGHRACVGEQLARTELFIFLTNLLRAFSFRLPEGAKELNKAPVAKVTVHPQPYKLCAIPTQA